jgi:Rrf2 family protein
MKLTHSSSYAVHALAHLAGAGAGRRVASHDIARARGIPAPLLQNVLRPLVSARILRAATGQRGGYRLAKPAARISLLEVLEVVDGPIWGEAPLALGSPDPLDGRLQEVCEEVAGLVRRRLGRVRLSDLAGGR